MADLNLASDLLSPTEAAYLLRVSARRVIQLADAGELPVLRTPLGRLFRRDDVERLAAERAARKQVPA